MNWFHSIQYEVIVEDGSSSEKAAVKKIVYQECKTVLRKAIKDFMVHMTDGTLALFFLSASFANWTAFF